MKYSLLLFVTLLAVSCSNSDRKISSIEVSEEQPAVEQGEIWGARQMNEARLIRNQFRDMLLESTGNSNLMKRDAHPKHHGCVEAKLTINNKALPLVNRVGLFGDNSTYKGIVRFSNGDPNHLKSDKENDVRGMALKLFDVPYENFLATSGVEAVNPVHDFVFMNSKEFFIKNPAHYGRFMDSLKRGGFSVAAFGARAVIDPTDDFVSILTRAFKMKVGSPLDIDYHSATPYKIGPDSMKMKFKTCKKKTYFSRKQRRDKGDNFLSKQLVKYLDKNSTCFDFLVQLNKDPETNKIENSQQKWSEKKSPYIKVGRLNIPQQSSASIKGRNEVCENASFNPWRAPIENRPLGGVNRIRLEVYIKQAKMRQNHNGIVYPGPDFRN